MKDNKIVIKTNFDLNKNGMIPNNFLPYIVEYLYDYIKANNDYNSILISKNIVYDWNYDVIIGKVSDNCYSLNIKEYQGNKIGLLEVIDTFYYKVYCTDEELLGLYVIYKMTNNVKKLNECVIFEQE